MRSSALICLALFNVIEYSNTIDGPYEYHGFCINVHINNKMNLLRKLQNCTVILGDVKLLMDRAKPGDFKDISFPHLREITGYMALYRVFGLDSVGDLFPNLMRIRGNTLLWDYALIISDMPKLREIGLSNLLKIDRGGVIVWTGPLTCYVESVNWKAIAPNTRHVLSVFDSFNRCKNIHCTCSTNSSVNYCWNNRKCQRFLEGPEAEKCSSECIGCRKTNSRDCSLCRNFRYGDKCVPVCPEGTIPLTEGNYCVTIDECTHLDRWLWNNTCVPDCPANFIKHRSAEGTTCEPCDNCHLTCYNLSIHHIESIQAAANCTYIKGHLSIHVRAPPEAMTELRYYLKNIREVTDYVEIHGSLVITSLDFLEGLQLIGGENLYNGKYSLIVHDMHNLQRLFPENVTHNLRVNRGSMSFYRNQMLCVREIDKLLPLFPVRPSDLDIPQGLNGYSGSCDEVILNLTVSVKNESSVTVTFYPESNMNVQYTILYVKISRGVENIIVPEACNETDWHAISVIQSKKARVMKVELSSLHPATNYAMCVEKYNPDYNHLSRSSVKKFSTSVGKPEPPFIVELTASASDVVVIRWVDHLDYLPHIVRYELDVILVEILSSDILARDHCLNYLYEWQEDYSVHAKVMKPPNNYDRSCESMCGVLSTVTVGAMVEEYFDICQTIHGCDSTNERPENKTIGSYVTKLALGINGTRKDYQVGGLAPYRDYRFKLRSCTKEVCSISARSVVKTLRAIEADTSILTFLSANEQGHVSVKWDPPETINGAVLSYTVEVSPVIKFDDYSRILPQTFCVAGNVSSLLVKVQGANKYIVRVCTTTLASSYACSEWKKVVVSTFLDSYWWMSGIFFGIIICTISCVIGWKFKEKEIHMDNIPLVDATAMYRSLSEPPATMSDFAPIYNIQLGESYL
ncbi:unnamed protein product [Leptosia nina]|uniref:receptor protein-tyrosine kinase n=1 Tax=Leptosia nina TaxID=320188 RepID=A0AAV1J464_9NEOP